MTKFLENLPKIQVTPRVYRELPESPGVYVFFRGNSVLYVGKAINLRRRVSSYFDINLGPKTRRMISEAKFIAFVQVTSELEALLLEAKLIRTYMPKFNIAAKDDKHPLYIRITKEKYPRVVTARKIDSKEKNIAFYGPFPSSASVRLVLKMIRRIFPYSDHKIGKRACLYSHIKLCKPCPNEIEQEFEEDKRESLRKEYRDNIRKINTVLSGKFNGVRRSLVKEMERLSEKAMYEDAINLREKIKKLDYITSPQIPTDYFIENPNLYQDIRQKEIRDLQSIVSKYTKINQPKRIECFDIAHLAGTNPTASMVTFIDAEPAKEYYRRFKINQKKGNSDVDSMREVIKRRIKNLDNWGKPDLIIVDGGKAQVGVFVSELKGVDIPVVGLAKRFETLVIPIFLAGTTILKEFRLPQGPAKSLVQRLRDEAHRFARRYHHLLVSREISSG